MKVEGIIGIAALAAIGLTNSNNTNDDNKSNTRGNKRNSVDLYSDKNNQYEMNYDRKGNPIFYHFEESEGIVINLKNDENGYPILYDKDGKIVEYRKNINEKEEKEEDKDKEVNSYKIKEIKIKNGDWNKSTVKIERRVKSSKDWVGLYWKGEKPGDILAIKYGYVNDDGVATLNQGDSRLGNYQKAMSKEYTVYLFQNDTYTVLAAETLYIKEN